MRRPGPSFQEPRRVPGGDPDTAFGKELKTRPEANAESRLKHIVQIQGSGSMVTTSPSKEITRRDKRTGKVLAQRGHRGW